ncbi:MAG: hypothetical protein IT212_07740 [Bacteroidia bacterium]|nr:hypothetical protein [Bacteroidia bacterium]
MAVANNVEVIQQSINGTMYWLVLRNGKIINKAFTVQSEAVAYAASITTPTPTVATPLITTILIDLKQTETVGNATDGGTTVHYLTYRDGECVADVTDQSTAYNYYDALVLSPPANSVIVLKTQEFERI